MRRKGKRTLRAVLDKRGRALLIIGSILLLAAYVLPRSELLYAASLLMGLPLLSLASLRMRRRRLGVSRRFSPSIAEAGRPVTVRVEVRNLASTRTGAAMWRDEWPWAPWGTVSARLPSLSRNRGALGAGSVIVDYFLEPPRRGVFDIGPLIVELSDPFQLARGEIVLGERQKLVVTPHVAELPITGLAIAAEDGSARAFQRLNSSGGDDIMTREYRHGDPMRRVHWKASARQGELMVRLEEQRSHARARILLDTRRAGYRDTTPESDDQSESDSFEWSVAFTASLTIHLQRFGFIVDIIETGFRQIRSTEHREEFLESLAAVALVDGVGTSRPLSMLVDSGRSLGSIFAVVADAERETVEHLAAQRGQFDTALAFVVNPHNDVVLAPLRDAGWSCVAVRPTDDLAAVWLAGNALRETNRARP